MLALKVRTYEQDHCIVLSFTLLSSSHKGLVVDTRIRFIGEIRDDYEITEFTEIGQYLYKIARKDNVTNFLETGASTGGSGRCIATGLQDTTGKLYTFEASKTRYQSLVNNLRGLPVIAYNESSVLTKGISSYYQVDSDEFAACNQTFEKLLQNIKFDACFLDSINLCQSLELQMVLCVKIRHILMHEPDHKCPGYDTLLLQNGYQLISASRDEINRTEGRIAARHCQPLWVHYKYTGFPLPGCL